MKRRAWLFALLVLAGCVKGTPVEPDWFCARADTVVVGQPWHGEVRACIAVPPIQTQVRR